MLMQGEWGGVKVVPLTPALTGKTPQFELTEDYLKTVLYR